MAMGLDQQNSIPWRLICAGVLVLPLSPLLGGLAIITVCSWSWWRLGRSHLQQPLTWSFALLSLLLLLSALQAQDISTALLGLANLLPFIAIFIASRSLIQQPQQRQQLAEAIALSSLPVALIGLGQQYLGWHGPIDWGWLISWQLQAGGTPPGRMSSVFGYANPLANFSVIAWTLSVGLTIQAWRTRPSHHPWAWPIWGWGGLVLANSLVLFATSSRNGWAVAIAIALTYAVLLGWHWLIAAVGAMATLILGAAFAPTPLQSPLQQLVPRAIWARLNDDLYPNRPIETLRISQWQFAWDLSRDRPLWGWGLRHFSHLYQDQTGFWLGHPHNLPLMLLAETGIPATLLLYLNVGWVCYRGVNHLNPLEPLRSQNNLISLTLLLAFAATTLFHLIDVTLFDARINTLGWLLLAAIDEGETLPRHKNPEAKTSG